MISRTKTVAHVSETPIREESGVGRVSWHWRKAFVSRGWNFVHFGPDTCRRPPHRNLLDFWAWASLRSSGIKPDCILVHEPLAGRFLHEGVPVALFSHGIEDRVSELCRALEPPNSGLRQFIMRPLWQRRIRSARNGLRSAGLLLLLNQDDSLWAQQRHHRNPADIFVYRNGVCPPPPGWKRSDGKVRLDLLFLGSWIPRKGTKELIQAALVLRENGFDVKWTLAGVGQHEEAIRAEWPERMRSQVEIIPSFTCQQELDLMARTDVFVLPSIAEGQPLALLQAMRCGICCVTTRSCGQKDFVSHGDNGLLIEPGDANALAETLQTVLRDATLRERIGSRALQTMRGREWSAVADEVVDRIERFLQTPKT